MGEGGGGERDIPGRPKETGETVDRRQNSMEVLRRCPLAIAQRLVHYAIAVSTAVFGQSRKDNVRCTAVDAAWTTRSERSPTFGAAQLHLPTHDLFWAKLNVQLHLPPHLLISPGTL